MVQKIKSKELKPPAGFAGKLAAKFLDVSEWLFHKFSIPGDYPVFDNAKFPWVAAIEAEYPKIRAELDRVMQRRDELLNFQDISTDIETIQTDENWKTFAFCGYGVWANENCKQCPDTVAALNKIPGFKTGFFSILAPNKHIPAHRGPFNGVLRLHLGLIVPEPNEKVRIRVNNEIAHWHEGKALIFDDSYDHEVWNDTDHWRVVLFVDFVRPVYFPFNLLNWLILRLAVFTPFIREASENQAKWEKEYYAAAQAMRGR